MGVQEAIVKKVFKEISDRIDTPYDNFVLENINDDHCLRIAVMEGEYKWHYHKNTDELFVVLEGVLRIEIQGNDTILLRPGEYVKIPCKTVHKTSACGRTVNLCFEKTAEDTIYTD